MALHKIKEQQVNPQAAWWPQHPLVQQNSLSPVTAQRLERVGAVQAKALPLTQRSISYATLKQLKYDLAVIDKRLNRFMDQIEKLEKEAQLLEEFRRKLAQAKAEAKQKGEEFMLELSKDPEMQKLIEQIRAIDPALIKEGQTTFSQSEAEELIGNISALRDRKLKTEISTLQQKFQFSDKQQQMLIEIWSRIKKTEHEINTRWRQ